VNERARNVLAPVVGLAVFFGLWELLVRAFSVEAFILQKPSTIFSNLSGARSLYWSNGLVTLREAALGFVTGLLVALVVATPMALSRFVEHAVQPVAVLIQVTPIIAYAPAVVIWQRGSTARSVLVLTTIVSFVPFLFAAVTGLRSVDPATLELLRSVDASGPEIYRRLRLPHALPYLFAAGRIAVGLSLIGAVLGEWFALADNRRGGLGALIKSASNQNNAPELWAATLALAIIGGLAVWMLTILERVLLRWHSSQQP